jgi:hypothetical protein
MSIKDLKLRWASLWNKDAYDSATCAFCGRSRRVVKKLIEGPAAFICDACVVASVGVIASGSAGALEETGVAALAYVVAAIDVKAPYGEVEPLLEAMLALTKTSTSGLRVYQEAERRGHFVLALRALTRIPAGQRSATIWVNIAAVALDCDDLVAAREALESLRALPGGDTMYAQCHRAVLAARTGGALGHDEVDELVARARQHPRPELLREALEVLARRRARDGDGAGALAAVDEALASRRNAPLGILRGDLLADTDRAAAEAAWRDALEVAHPDGVHARIARERLSRGRPYRNS